MDTAHLPIVELQRLLSRVSEHGSQHLTDAEADLEQTLHLLEQAIKTLSAGFIQINQLVQQQQRLFDVKLEQYGIDNRYQPDLTALQEKIQQNINTVITGLQFQDLTSQLITRSMKRIAGLRDLLTTLASDECTFEQFDSAEHMLENMHTSLNLKSGALKDGLFQEVNQKHMQSGEIEMF